MKYQGEFPNVQTHWTNQDCIDGMMAFCEKYSDDNTFRYVRWSSDTKTHQCPLCHPEKYQGNIKYKGWQCIGFATAAVYHGGTVRTVKCNCSGLTNNSKMESITLAKFKAQNGPDWIMISNGGKYNGVSIKDSSLQKGDILFCYNADGSAQHVAMYAGDGYYTDCTSGSNIANNITYRQKKYAALAKRLHVTRAFRYTGIGTGVRGYMKKGDHNDEVRKLQGFLNWALDLSLVEDGWFGQATHDAVCAFQEKAIGLGTGDGLFGEKSLAAAKAFEKADPKQKYQGKLPTVHLVKTNQETINDTITWLKWIAGNNDFHYGYGKDAHHNGCYFCGTQPSSKKKSGIKMWEYTYCCNPYIGAGWAHGGCVPAALTLCRKGSSWGFKKDEGYNKSSLFDNLGHPAQSSLKPGDVLCKDTHVAMYIGNGKLIEASGGDDNVIHSTKWNNSIKINTLTAARYAKFPRVHRFNSRVDMDLIMKLGEVSARVGLWQAFLDWYYDGQVGCADGIFGFNTHNWTCKFQEEVIGPGQGDGLVGQKTIDAAANVEKGGPTPPIPTTEWKGMDISDWQGMLSVDDFVKAKNSGIQYVIIRVGFTGSESNNPTVDAKFENNYANATAAGLPVGIYYYSMATTEAKSIEEATFCVAKARGKNLSYPIYIDVEDNSKQGKQSKETLAAVCNAFCNIIEANGYHGGVYASTSWFNNKIGTVSDEYTKWVAQYYDRCQYEGKYDMWQYSSSESVPGIASKTDVNKCYHDFPNDRPVINKNYTGALPTSYPSRGYYKKGDTGLGVAQWQAFLDWYYNGQVGTAEGIFGPNTHNWTVRWQNEVMGQGQGDGSVGPKTIQAAKDVRK